MIALGMTQSKAHFGMALFLGKAGISAREREYAIQALTQYAMRKAPKHVGKIAGRRMSNCIHTLATLAYEEYAYSAASSVHCHYCQGKGWRELWRDVTIYPGYVGMDGEEKIPPTIERQRVREYCQLCKGKGEICKRCRNCQGKGKTLDRQASKASGTTVLRECARCHGNGVSRLPSSIAYRAITLLLPTLTQSSWSRHWKPFYEALVAKCHGEEQVAAVIFDEITK
ncbi:putative chaparone [Serratia fonticola AU-P3(3)]|nr:putative chaparone [Serratia fonticola AU-P3(3)]